MRLNTLLISVAALAGFASTANAHAIASFSDLDGSSAAHGELRHILVGDRKLDAGISLPSGVVRSDGVSTAFLCFTPVGGDGADRVASYDIKTGSWSLDDKRPSLTPRANGGCAHELNG